MNTKANLIVEQIGDNTRIRLQNPNASEFMVRDLTNIQVYKLIELLEKTQKITVDPELVGHIDESCNHRNGEEATKCDRCSYG